MINPGVSLGRRRLLVRVGVLVVVVLWFLLFGSPVSHADEVGVLEEAAQTVETAAEPIVAVVEPVVQTAQPAVQQPLEQAVPAVEETVDAAGQAVEPAVHQPVKAVIRVVEPAVHQPVAPTPVEQVVEPVIESAPAPVTPQVPSTVSPNGSQPVEVSDPPGVDRVNAGAKGPGHEQRQPETAERTYATDLAPRALGGPVILQRSGGGDTRGDGDDPEDPALWALTNALMHLLAGDPLPGAIDAGLPAGVTSARTPWTALLLGTGLLLAGLSLVLERRRTES